jgi:hypothetical protein
MGYPDSFSFDVNVRSRAGADSDDFVDRGGAPQDELFTDCDDTTRPTDEPSAVQYCISNDLI